MFTRGIRFEVAQDVLGALIAHWAEAAAQVRDAANPDASRLATIQAEQRKLRILRDVLDPHDAAQIETVIAEHAPARTRITGRPCNSRRPASAFCKRRKLREWHKCAGASRPLVKLVTHHATALKSLKPAPGAAYGRITPTLRAYDTAHRNGAQNPAATSPCSGRAVLKRESAVRMQWGAVSVP